ncbi:MAG: zinc ribbon domain-containing protein [Polyangiaceae bacterium]|nr:zinc ribbon domain-containing protein [Polyangiaceae bacterium]
MFCPNCGTQNPDTATTCTKCGFALKGAAAPKFKGTMLMMNAPPNLGAGAPGAPPAPAAPGAPARPVMKGTMIGVAPPSPGAVAPPAPMAPPEPPPPAPAPPADFGAPPPGFGAPPPGFGAPPPAAPQHAGPPPGMNPLGATVAADPGMMAGFGMGPGGPPPAAPPPPAGFPPPGGDPGFGGPPAGFGGPPPGGPPGGFGGPPPGGPPGGFGGPPPGGPPGGFGGPPPGGPAPGGFGGPGMGAPPGAMMPMGGAPMAAPVGAHGPIGQERNPIMTLLIGMVCGFYLMYWLWLSLNELKAFRQKDDINPILYLLLFIVFVWGLPEKVYEAKVMAGIPNPEKPNAIMYFLLSPYFLTNDLNEIWAAARARQGGG